MKKSGSYVTQGNQMYVHTRGFDYGDSNEPEQVLEIGFINGQVGEIRSTKPSSTGIARLEPLLIGGIYPQHNEDRVLIKLDKSTPKTLIEALISTGGPQTSITIMVFQFTCGTARALVSNVTGGKNVRWINTHTTVGKNFYLSPEKTLKRKKSMKP